MGFFDKIFNFEKSRLKKLNKITNKVLAYEKQIAALSDDELKAKTPEFKKRIADGETLDSLLPETFAVAREAARRTLGQFPYPVQITGAIVLHQGDVAEMRTGEGKTLTATMTCLFKRSCGKKGSTLLPLTNT